MLREYLPFWARLTEGQQRRLEEGAAVRRFARGEMCTAAGRSARGLSCPPRDSSAPICSPTRGGS